ncbi:hypothetical protein [Streptococcus macacae]|uniref:Prophage Lp1 protein 6 n=1 Tax=Streptococcus macacae NCTC 11558 TaxID=764298 RepID=G5JV31_9STRE|nr:hypothetical protein [Streptococcus macacae]EHJ53371.1 hypothetical protein STRMA_1416 [Streptococcus macacae NCTC 11558]SUN79336.1 Prophage Lp1 protein 6 [Streptococcus macacae NCTC 11558]
MKTKNLALTNGIVGLIGGIFLLIAIWFIFGAAATGSTAATGLMTAFVYIVKLAILILGIIGAVYYKEDSRVGAAPSILMIIGGAVSLIPFLGWVGGILAIIGGSLYLASLKSFTE